MYRIVRQRLRRQLLVNVYDYMRQHMQYRLCRYVCCRMQVNLWTGLQQRLYCNLRRQLHVRLRRIMRLYLYRTLCRMHG